MNKFIKKFKIFEIKLGREATWHIMLLVFFVAFIVVFLLNIYSFAEARKDLSADIGNVEYEPLVLKKDILDRAVAELENKRIIFENSFLLEPDIEDPSRPRSSTDRTGAF